MLAYWETSLFDHTIQQQLVKNITGILHLIEIYYKQIVQAYNKYLCKEGFDGKYELF